MFMFRYLKIVLAHVNPKPNKKPNSGKFELQYIYYYVNQILSTKSLVTGIFNNIKKCECKLNEKYKNNPVELRKPETRQKIQPQTNRIFCR